MNVKIEYLDGQYHIYDENGVMLEPDFQDVDEAFQVCDKMGWNVIYCD